MPDEVNRRLAGHSLKEKPSMPHKVSGLWMGPITQAKNARRFSTFKLRLSPRARPMKAAMKAGRLEMRLGLWLVKERASKRLPSAGGLSKARPGKPQSRHQTPMWRAAGKADQSSKSQRHGDGGASLGLGLRTGPSWSVGGLRLRKAAWLRRLRGCGPCAGAPHER